MVDLVSGSSIDVDNPHIDLETSAPGYVNDVFVKEGPPGPTGATGPANSLSIGIVTTGAAGSSASANIAGTPPSQTLSLTIPKGDTGATGPTGPAGSVTYGTTAGTATEGNDSRVTGAAQKSANLSDLANTTTARTNLGLGTAAPLNVPASGNAAAGEVVKGSDTRLTDARTPTAHTHAASDLTATGTRDATTFLRGDNTWAAPSGGGSTELLVSVQYNPATATTATQAGGAGTGFSDVDATNLAVTFTVPASGSVIVSLTARAGTNSSANAAIWAVGVAGTVVASTASKLNEGAGISPIKTTHRFKVTGLTPGASITYRWMHSNASSSTTTTAYGGGSASAHGPALMEVWSA